MGRIILIVVVLLIVILIACILGWYISTYNNIQVTRLKVKEGLSGIDVALTKRYDVLTKMLDTVKSYQKYEKELFTEVIQLRMGMNMQEREKVNGQMDALSGEINLLAENYPELKSSNNFVELQKAIADVEEHLQAARRMYNANVTKYNANLVAFPSSIVAKMMGAKEEEFFTAEDVKKKDVVMNFN